MKCPGCKFVSSDLRDLCPKCLLDLRPHKKVMNLPVTFPDSPYEELLQKTARKSLKKSGRKKKDAPGFGGILSALFGPTPQKKKKKKKKKDKSPAAEHAVEAPEPPISEELLNVSSEETDELPVDEAESSDDSSYEAETKDLAVNQLMEALPEEEFPEPEPESEPEPETDTEIEPAAEYQQELPEAELHVGEEDSPAGGQEVLTQEQAPAPEKEKKGFFASMFGKKDKPEESPIDEAPVETTSEDESALSEISRAEYAAEELNQTLEQAEHDSSIVQEDNILHTIEDEEDIGSRQAIPKVIDFSDSEEGLSRFLDQIDDSEISIEAVSEETGAEDAESGQEKAGIEFDFDLHQETEDTDDGPEEAVADFDFDLSEIADATESEGDEDSTEDSGPEFILPEDHAEEVVSEDQAQEALATLSPEESSFSNEEAESTTEEELEEDKAQEAEPETDPEPEETLIEEEGTELSEAVGDVEIHYELPEGEDAEELVPVEEYDELVQQALQENPDATEVVIEVIEEDDGSEEAYEEEFAEPLLEEEVRFEATPEPPSFNREPEAPNTEPVEEEQDLNEPDLDDSELEAIAPEFEHEHEAGQALPGEDAPLEEKIEEKKSGFFASLFGRKESKSEIEPELPAELEAHEEVTPAEEPTGEPEADFQPEIPTEEVDEDEITTLETDTEDNEDEAQALSTDTDLDQSYTGSEDQEEPGAIEDDSADGEQEAEEFEAEINAAQQLTQDASIPTVEFDDAPEDSPQETEQKPEDEDGADSFDEEPEELISSDSEEDEEDSDLPVEESYEEHETETKSQNGYHTPESAVRPTYTPPAAVAGGLGQQQVSALFTEALNTTEEQFDVAIALEQISVDIDPARDALLFDLAMQAILNPEFDREFDQAMLSEDRAVEAHSLEAALEVVEKKISAPILTMKSQPATTDEVKIKVYEEQVAPVGLRFLAGLLDVGAVLLASMLITILFAGSDSALSDGVFSGQALQTPVLVSLLGFFVSLFLILLLLYSVVSMTAFRKTFGMTIAGLRVVKDNGNRMDGANALVRGMVFPLSLVLFGALPLLFGRNTLHDALAQTLVVSSHRPTLEEEK